VSKWRRTALNCTKSARRGNREKNAVVVPSFGGLASIAGLWKNAIDCGFLSPHPTIDEMSELPEPEFRASIAPLLWHHISSRR
jgi:hypothetical protein